VKSIQVQKRSRAGYARVEQGKGWQTTVTPESELPCLIERAHRLVERLRTWSRTHLPA